MISNDILLPNSQVVTIRPYRQDDLPAILEVYANSKLDELQFEHTTFRFVPLDRDEDRFNGFLESDVFVCERGSELVAYAAIFQQGIRALYVDKSARGFGIGRALLEHVLRTIQQQSSAQGQVAEPYLHVVKSNVPAIQLYQSYGFGVNSEITVEYSHQPVQVYTMSLAEFGCGLSGESTGK